MGNWKRFAKLSIFLSVFAFAQKGQSEIIDESSFSFQPNLSALRQGDMQLSMSLTEGSSGKALPFRLFDDDSRLRKSGDPKLISFKMAFLVPKNSKFVQSSNFFSPSTVSALTQSKIEHETGSSGSRNYVLSDSNALGSFRYGLEVKHHASPQSLQADPTVSRAIAQVSGSGSKSPVAATSLRADQYSDQFDGASYLFQYYSAGCDQTLVVGHGVVSMRDSTWNKIPWFVGRESTVFGRLREFAGSVAAVLKEMPAE